VAEGTAITAPAVTCTSNAGSTTVTSGLDWTGAPNWSNPEGGVYTNISVSASTGNCSGETATCNGTITVQAGIIFGTSIEYEGENYETVKIGTQTWFQGNLNYEVEGSKCYNNDPANCEKYGRLYNWAMAMDLPSSCNTRSCASSINAKHRGVCPNGWHIPSDADWNVLMKFLNPSCSNNSSCAGAGTKLKATNGWNDNGSKSGNGTDNYGFAALPGGDGNTNGEFYDVGEIGVWWATTESYGVDAYSRGIRYNEERVIRGTSPKVYIFYSIRCIQD